MPGITFISSDGERRIIDVPEGESLMRAALHHGVDEILGECGGACCCATCHIYVDGASMAKLPPAADMELEVLAFVAAPRRSGSRLACQVVADRQADGLIVQLPATQI
jgi:2Fe-2S ferredoxin